MKKNRGGLVHVPRSGELGQVARPYFQFEAACLSLIGAKRSPHTRAAYKRDLRRWLDFCALHDLDPTAPPLDDVTAFREHLTSILSNESARRVLAAMSGLYRALLRGRAVRSNPFHPAVLSWPAASGIPKTRMVTDDTALAMINHAKADKNIRRGLRDAAILHLLYDTGLRRSSVAQIIRAKYNVNTGSIETVVKGGKSAELVVPEETAVALDAWIPHVPAGSEFLFPGKRGSINVATINKLVKHRANAVGAKHVHPHSFRAAFVTAGYDAGLPEHEVQASVHHSDPSTTRRYDRHARGRQVATQVATFRKKKGP